MPQDPYNPNGSPGYAITPGGNAYQATPNGGYQSPDDWHAYTNDPYNPSQVSHQNDSTASGWDMGQQANAAKSVSTGNGLHPPSGTGFDPWELAQEASNGRAAQANYGNAYQSRGMYQDSYGQQQQSLALLRNAAQGNGPSAAQSQFRQGLDQSMQAQMAMAASSRGGGANLAAAQSQAAMQGAQMRAQGTTQSAQLRAQEMQQAQQAYSQMSLGMGSQNLNAQQLDSQMAMDQARLVEQQNQIDAQTALGWGGLKQSGLNNKADNDAKTYGINMQHDTSDQDRDAQRNKDMAAAVTGMTSGLAGMFSDVRLKDDVLPAGAVSEGTKSGGRHMPLASVMSDERVKGGASSGPTDADRFLAHLHPYTYRYRDPSLEPSSDPNGGRYLGVMAQDVEKSPTGPQIVKDTPRGKALEGGAMMSAMAGGMGRLHERLSEIESKLGKR